MARFPQDVIQHLRTLLSIAFAGPAAFAFLPALCLAAYWFGGEGALVVLAAVIPILYLSFSGVKARNSNHYVPSDILSRTLFETRLADVLAQAETTGKKTAAFVILIEELDQVALRFGQAAADAVVLRTVDRLKSTVRHDDHIGQISDAKFAICTAPVRQLDLELCLQMAGRIQTAIEEPISIDGLNIYVTASIGFCQHNRAPEKTGDKWFAAAATALGEAQRRGHSSVRAYSDQMRLNRQARVDLMDEVENALANGQIQPWFQPQISTDTGHITGFEALARWSHPERGMISPADFLPAMEQAGQLERLAEVMMYHSFAALKAWDGAGLDVPQVGVNFTGSELNNPNLLDKIKWELDRFELTPQRLAVEVLETVVASAPDDIITLNINALGKLGCRIDLDDFGTGHASIASIRRFAVSRIKIDRSFVMKADRDPEQQRMISAILTMAERLEVETLAEGVETVGEHVLLAQLGCDHVQGFGIARPMPIEQTFDWMQQHNAKLEDVPHILSGKAR